MFTKRMKSLFILIIIAVLSTGFSPKKDLEKKVIFPEPFAFSIDDLGWMNGNNAGHGDRIGPYRAGIDRNFDLKDYKAIVKVAKEVGVRVKSLFILAEMDRLNILKNYPTTTWERDQWNNKENIGPMQFRIMNYVKNHSAYLEFGLHGVAHEYWPEDGVRKRAEWYCVEENHPWPEDTIQRHIEAFKKIMAQYGLSDEKGHSFPESFVPCDYSYYWNPQGEYSLGSVLNEYGVKYVNTEFDYVTELNPPEGPNAGGVDHGVLVIDRSNFEDLSGISWYKYSSLPKTPLKEQGSNMVETHFPNWLAQDQFLQKSVNQNFIDYYRKVQRQSNRYVAKNSEQFYSQWLYNKYAEVKISGDGKVIINNCNMPDEVYEHDLLKNMVLKIDLEKGEHVQEASINGESIVAYYEEQGYGFIYLPPLEQNEYRVNYETGSKVEMPHVYNDGTYNVYQFNHHKGEGTEIKVRIYGDQNLKIRNVEDYQVNQISSTNKDLKINDINYSKQRDELILSLDAHDIQGETGIIKLNSIAYEN